MKHKKKCGKVPMLKSGKKMVRTFKKDCGVWGFDLTDFGSAEKFEKVLKNNNISSMPTKWCERNQERPLCKFEWLGKNVSLITANNPITGEYANEGNRTPEKGYASYMGICGNPSQVQKLVKDIKKVAKDGIKDESVCERSFI